MTINKRAQAGTLESNDIMITLEPGNKGLEIKLNSSVKAQFGEEIEKVIREELEKKKISSVTVHATDRGALECTIRARLETAIGRAMQ